MLAVVPYYQWLGSVLNSLLYVAAGCFFYFRMPRKIGTGLDKASNTEEKKIKRTKYFKRLGLLFFILALADFNFNYFTPHRYRIALWEPQLPAPSFTEAGTQNLSTTNPPLLVLRPRFSVLPRRNDEIKGISLKRATH